MSLENEQAIRTYTLLFVLAKINMHVPDKDFENTDLTNKLMEDFERNISIQHLLLSLNEW